MKKIKNMTDKVTQEQNKYVTITCGICESRLSLAIQCNLSNSQKWKSVQVSNDNLYIDFGEFKVTIHSLESFYLEMFAKEVEIN